MKLFAPKYYKDFKCIADKCTHSCCIGWEIDIDADTLKKYKSTRAPYIRNVLNSIDTEDTPHFKLDIHERCPHLESSGLCNIITHLGEGYLCEICREHPRFYNDTPKGKEVGLGMACEEACRIILCSDDYSELIQIGEVDDSAGTFDFDALSHRQHIYSILSSSKLSYEERLNLIYEEYNIFPLNAEKAKTLLNSLEYLDEEHNDLFLCYSASTKTPRELEKMLERALAYFVYRHCSSAYDKDELYAALGFCLFCERLICSVANTIGDIGLAARTVSEEFEYSEDNTYKIKLHYYNN